MLRSYTSTKIGLASRVSEALNLYRIHSQNIPERVDLLLRRVRDAEQEVRRYTGKKLEDLDVLEIGPGQMLKYLKYFSIRNRAIGIDLDVVTDRVSGASLSHMLRVNGFMRTGKTVARKVLGLDAQFNKEMCRQLGLDRLPEPRVLQMNAEKMEFDDATFDFVFSYSTFEHLADPGAVIDQINRVLRPGGVAYINLHLYTSDSGCHDPRISAGRREALPLWAHLRPAHSKKVRGNAFLNKIRLSDWQDLFLTRNRNVLLRAVDDENQALRPELARLRKSGELVEYTDEELLTVQLVAMWKRDLD
jgi:SAM-dependent methyltransferase